MSSTLRFPHSTFPSTPLLARLKNLFFGVKHMLMLNFCNFWDFVVKLEAINEKKKNLKFEMLN